MSVTMSASTPRLSFSREAPLTDELFTQLCQANPLMRLERSAEGELVIMAPAGMESSGRNLILTGQLFVWVQKTGLGKAFDSSAGFTLPNGAIRSPDASWITSERLNTLTREQRDNSPRDLPRLRRGTAVPLGRCGHPQREDGGIPRVRGRLGWLIDPWSRRVEIYGPDRAWRCSTGQTVCQARTFCQG